MKSQEAWIICFLNSIDLISIFYYLILMNYLFIGSLVGFVAIVPIYFLSLEHWRLNQRFGEEKGKMLGDMLGMVSGWGLFIFWIGIWISPQPQIFTEDFKQVIFGEMSLNQIIMAAQIPIFLIAVWLGGSALKELSLEVSETHRPKKSSMHRSL